MRLSSRGSALGKPISTRARCWLAAINLQISCIGSAQDKLPRMTLRNKLLTQMALQRYESVAAQETEDTHPARERIPT